MREADRERETVTEWLRETEKQRKREWVSEWNRKHSEWDQNWRKRIGFLAFTVKDD